MIGLVDRPGPAFCWGRVWVSAASISSVFKRWSCDGIWRLLGSGAVSRNLPAGDESVGEAAQATSEGSSDGPGFAPRRPRPRPLKKPFDHAHRSRRYGDPRPDDTALKGGSWALGTCAMACTSMALTNKGRPTTDVDCGVSEHRLQRCFNVMTSPMRQSVGLAVPISYRTVYASGVFITLAVTTVRAAS
jgi:hypothetical protein